MIRVMHRPDGGLVTLVLATALALSGCATPEEPPSLTQARAMVSDAGRDPRLAQYAPSEFERVQESLRKAETYWHDEEDPEGTAHLAYLTRQRVEIARAAALRNLTDQKSAALEDERQQLLAELESRVSTRLETERRDQQEAANATQLQARLASLGARVETTARGLALRLTALPFAIDASELAPDAKVKLKPLAEFLGAHPQRSVVIEGYTDNRGPAAYNQHLSEQRAQTVLRYLATNGVAVTRMRAVGYGAQHPIAPNDTLEGRRQNRRVEVIILKAERPSDSVTRD